MKWLRWAGMPCFALALTAGAAFAQDVDAEVTIAVVGPLAVPESAAEQGRISSTFGTATANDSRGKAEEQRIVAQEKGAAKKQAGLDVAADASENRAEVSEAARDSRANFVRGDGLRLTMPAELPPLPEQAPELPVTPDLRDRPEVPVGSPAA